MLQQVVAIGRSFWDWIDKRQIDQHLMAWSTYFVTLRYVRESWAFAENHTRLSGSELAMVLTAILAPWALIQTAVFKWYFNRGGQ